MGTFTIYTGVMGAGKTSILITMSKNLTYNNNRVYHIKPEGDTRDGHKIYSRNITDHIIADLLISPEAKIPTAELIDKCIDYVIVDEVQFMTEKQVNQLYELSAKTHINVLLFGIKMTWKGTIFPSMALALSLADPNGISTISAKSGNKDLTHHIKLIDGEPADISTDDDVAEAGDLTEESVVKYKPVTKQEFYKTYPNQTELIYGYK